MSESIKYQKKFIYIYVGLYNACQNKLDLFSRAASNKRQQNIFTSRKKNIFTSRKKKYIQFDNAR